MPRPRPPGLQLRRSRHGKPVWYVRVARGPLIRIHEQFGTPQFDAAYKGKNYAEQLRLGKLILASSPDNSAVTIIMGLAGLGDAALLNDSAESAKKAIALLEGGKPFAPLASKDQALAFLNYVVAKSSLKSAPADAIPQHLAPRRLRYRR